MSPSRRSPRPLALALDGVRSELAPQTLLADVQAIWPGAVGPVIAAQAQPVSERAGALTISCAASVWAQELDLMATSIIERINGALGGERIVRLRCVTTPPPQG